MPPHRSPPRNSPYLPPRYLNDPELADRFLQRSIEPLMDPDTQAASADSLLRVFMDEFAKRVS